MTRGRKPVATFTSKEMHINEISTTATNNGAYTVESLTKGMWILTNYAKPGDKILDTHVGSASSLIACYDMGFDYVGFEIDEEYYKLAKKRLDEVMAQVRWEF